MNGSLEMPGLSKIGMHSFLTLKNLHKALFFEYLGFNFEKIISIETRS